MNSIKKLLCSFVLMTSCSFVFSSDKCPQCQELYEKKGEHKEIVLHQSLDKKEKCSLCAECAKKALNEVLAVDENNQFKKKRCSDCKKIYDASFKECDTCFHTLDFLSNDCKKCVNANCLGWGALVNYFDKSREVDPTAPNTRIAITTKGDECPVCKEKLVQRSGKTCSGCSKIYSVDKQVCSTCKNILDPVFICPGKDCKYVHTRPELQKIKNNLLFIDDDDDEDIDESKEGKNCCLCTEPFDDNDHKRIPLHPEIHNEQNDDEKECDAEHAVCQKCFKELEEIKEVEVRYNPEHMGYTTTIQSKRCPFCRSDLEKQWHNLEKFTLAENCCKKCKKVSPYLIKIHPRGDKKSKDTHRICVDCWVDGLTVEEARTCPCCQKKIKLFEWIQLNKPIAGDCSLCHTALNNDNKVDLSPDAFEDKDKHWICVNCLLKGVKDKNYRICVPCLHDIGDYSRFDKNLWKQIGQEKLKTICMHCFSAPGVIKLHPKELEETNQHRVCLDCFCKGNIFECPDKKCEKNFNYRDCINQLPNGYCHICREKLGDNDDRIALNPSGKDDAEKQVICLNCFHRGQKSEQARLNPCTDKILSLVEWMILFYTQLRNGYCTQCCTKLGNDDIKIALNPLGKDDAEKQVICLNCFHKGQESEKLRFNPFANKFFSIEEWNERFYDHVCYNCEKSFGQQPKFALPAGTVNTVKNACLCKTCFKDGLSRAYRELKAVLRPVDIRIFRSMVPSDCCKRCAQKIGNDGYVLHPGHAMCKTCFERKYKKHVVKHRSRWDRSAWMCPACDKILLKSDTQNVFSSQNVCVSCFKKIEADKSDSYIKLHRPQGCKKIL